MVGQYHGPEGTAALAVVAPVWNIIYSLGLLMGIGGSVIFSTKRGSEKKDGSENQYFTAAVIGPAILALLAWAALLRFERPILTFFGAGKGGRIREILRLALGTIAFFGLFWTALSMACPNLYIRIFMAPTQQILEMTPAIIRTYAWSFLLLPVNIFSTYYF